MIINGGNKSDFSYSKLSYTVQKKSNRVVELKEVFDKKRDSLKLPVGMSCLLSFYILLYHNRYISYLNAIFENNSSESAIKNFDLIVLLIVTATISMLYLLLKEFKKAKDSYDGLRKDYVMFSAQQNMTSMDSGV